ncbi:MAG TPA: 16S rRNA (adenine(1518)-N(6)/adenine(1519)-N(6))-dimethyltransferase RsmA [Chlamydiales bacterium]|nr:16S rRNA (adenine(1518)-N(6)/adenine(1519)-N(6))-dimethyltransferase RsmA [Chlamydiales bacterium]
MIDPNIVRKIVDMAEIRPGDTVLEIGPGPGALTAELLSAGAHVLAIEMDRTFARELIRLQTSDQRLRVVEADFLKFPLEHLRSPLKVVANLPYHITAPILGKICQASKLFSSMTLMVQKEVGERIVASCGCKDYSPLTVFIQFYTRIRRLISVPASCFYPRPKVDSSVIRFDFQPPPPVDATAFFSLVKKAFQQRRKMVTTSLGIKKETLSAIGVNEGARPENLPLEKWLELFEKLDEHFS